MLDDALCSLLCSLIPVDAEGDAAAAMHASPCVAIRVRCWLLGVIADPFTLTRETSDVVREVKSEALMAKVMLSQTSLVILEPLDFQVERLENLLKCAAIPRNLIFSLLFINEGLTMPQPRFLLRRN
jgi:hypothetical protein